MVEIDEQILWFGKQARKRKNNPLTKGVHTLFLFSLQSMHIHSKLDRHTHQLLKIEYSSTENSKTSFYVLKYYATDTRPTLPCGPVLLISNKETENKRTMGAHSNPIGLKNVLIKENKTTLR